MGPRHCQALSTHARVRDEAAGKTKTLSTQSQGVEVYVRLLSRQSRVANAVLKNLLPQAIMIRELGQLGEPVLRDTILYHYQRNRNRVTVRSRRA